MQSKMLTPHNLVTDTAHLALGFAPLSLTAHVGEPALLLSLLNILIVAFLRWREQTIRARERLALGRLALELEHKSKVE
jgi:hypothetical protein